MPSFKKLLFTLILATASAAPLHAMGDRAQRLEALDEQVDIKRRNEINTRLAHHRDLRREWTAEKNKEDLIPWKQKSDASKQAHEKAKQELAQAERQFEAAGGKVEPVRRLGRATPKN